MDILQLDKNFVNATVDRDDVVWFDAKSKPFSLHGLYFDETENRFRRMPVKAAQKVGVGRDYMSAMTAGGRLRFITDSPYIAIRCVSGPEFKSEGKAAHGFSVYKNDAFCGVVFPNYNQFHDVVDNKIKFDGLKTPYEKGLGDIDIFFPNYNGVYELQIGLQKGCTVQPPKPYRYPKPVVFYGSSITQGGSCSHTGNNYIDLLSRTLSFDYVNLGFSGGAKGDPNMVEYLASLDASAFVIDYDHNAPTAEHLEATHYPLYERIRKAHPKTPIVFMSRPNIEADPIDAAKRRAVIFQTYQRAKKQDDKRVFFIGGEKLFGKEGRDVCTADGTHPNDLGFYRMYQNSLPTMKKAVKLGIQ